MNRVGHMRTHRVLIILLIAIGLGLAAANSVRWNEAAGLRQEIAVLQLSVEGLQQITSENSRLMGSLPDADTLSALRADRAAISRLAAEIEELKAGVRAREAALAFKK
jgi:hypothetical protein